ncbi:hypothetical protein VTJ83DRAFT_2916 [Remersonia thermophila]|uniref:Uncharacterized protein n=1 Tax=Remersonia thermophila TaxID=72144 RepID=A0ABR4DCJ9_9PEZI
MRIGTRPSMARVAIFVATLQPALAEMFYTVTSYYVYTLVPQVYPSTCSDNCNTYTYTSTLTVNPTVTPTAKPVSTRTLGFSYLDLEVVSVFLPPGAVPSSDLFTAETSTRNTNVFTYYAVSYTMTAPTSCPTPFVVATYGRVHVPDDVTRYISVLSTATTARSYRGETHTYFTYIIDRTNVPSSRLPHPKSGWDYTYDVKNCRNPTATGAERWGPSTTGHGGGPYTGDDDYDLTMCTVRTGCVELATWLIVIAAVIPSLFLLGFIESYLWFRRLMLGKPALRLGTISWCLLSLWFILLTRKADARRPGDQALMRNYWKSLSAGTRVRLWLKHGFRWRYPVELLGTPDGTAMTTVPPSAANGMAPA